MQAWNKETHEGEQEARSQEGSEAWREEAREAPQRHSYREHDDVRSQSTISKGPVFRGAFLCTLDTGHGCAQNGHAGVEPRHPNIFTPGHPSILPATAGLNQDGGGQDLFGDPHGWPNQSL